MAACQGFEPWLPGSEPGLLPIRGTRMDLTLGLAPRLTVSKAAFLL